MAGERPMPPAEPDLEVAGLPVPGHHDRLEDALGELLLAGPPSLRRITWALHGRAQRAQHAEQRLGPRLDMLALCIGI